MAEPGGTTMQMLWMRTEDGQTVFEDLEVAATEGPRGHETPVLSLAGAVFRNRQHALDLDYHNAPRRQLVIPLVGEITVEAGDGTVRHIAPGQVLLADDLTGQGHKSVFRPDEATTLFLLVPDDLDPRSWCE